MASDSSGSVTAHHQLNAHHGGLSTSLLGDDDDDDDPGSPSDKPVPRQKRRRVTRACDECRRRKVRCDGKMVCENCRIDGYTCTFDKPSNRRRGATTQYVASLEKKLERAEALLRKFNPEFDLSDLDSDSVAPQTSAKMGEGPQSPAPEPRAHPDTAQESRFTQEEEANVKTEELSSPESQDSDEEDDRSTVPMIIDLSDLQDDEVDRDGFLVHSRQAF